MGLVPLSVCAVGAGFLPVLRVALPVNPLGVGLRCQTDKNVFGQIKRSGSP